ncbi:hypothetical protein ACIRRI_31095 [Streptomyces mirabilis]|uniref:hypothetical protein n=1 Tax=Streptomyces mirabilis TaxID=68239 RepID=UPI00380B0ABF
MNTTRRFARIATTAGLTAVLVTAGMGGATAVSAPHGFAQAGSLRASATTDWTPITGPPRSITAKWVDTTDKPSGITVKLPGKAEPAKSSLTLDSKTVEIRLYKVEAEKKRLLFEVADTSGIDAKSGLDPAIRGVAVPLSGTVTSNRSLTVAGHPTRDGRITFTSDGVKSVVLVRAIATDGHMVLLAAGGPAANEKDVNQLYQHLTSSLHIP